MSETVAVITPQGLWLPLCAVRAWLTHPTNAGDVQRLVAVPGFEARDRRAAKHAHLN